MLTCRCALCDLCSWVAYVEPPYFEEMPFISSMYRAFKYNSSRPVSQPIVCRSTNLSYCITPVSTEPKCLLRYKQFSPWLLCFALAKTLTSCSFDSRCRLFEKIGWNFSSHRRRKCFIPVLSLSSRWPRFNNSDFFGKVSAIHCCDYSFAAVDLFI